MLDPQPDVSSFLTGINLCLSFILNGRRIDVGDTDILNLLVRRLDTLIDEIARSCVTLMEFNRTKGLRRDLLSEAWGLCLRNYIEIPTILGGLPDIESDNESYSNTTLEEDVSLKAVETGDEGSTNEENSHNDSHPFGPPEEDVSLNSDETGDEGSTNEEDSHYDSHPFGPPALDIPSAVINDQLSAFRVSFLYKLQEVSMVDDFVLAKEDAKYIKERLIEFARWQLDEMLSM